MNANSTNSKTMKPSQTNWKLLKAHFVEAQSCTLSVSGEIVAGRDDFRDAPGDAVAQVSKPAVSPTSKSAVRRSLDGLRIGKSATQQTWKSALLWLRLCRAALYRKIAFCGRSASASALELLDALPITNRRYGRLQICATPLRWVLSRGLLSSANHG